MRLDDTGVHVLPLSDNSDAALHITVIDVRYRVSGGSFFQVNTAVAAKLIQHVLAAAEPRPGMHMLDLYCGVGLFTVPLALAGAHVLGVEGNRLAAQDARHNLQAAAVDGSIVTGDVREALERKAIQAQAWDAIVVDPPRAGIEFGALQTLISLQTARLVYVSCDPATLARDIAILCKNGWTLVYAQPFDMFPQTHHVETLAVLQR